MRAPPKRKKRFWHLRLHGGEACPTSLISQFVHAQTTISILYAENEAEYQNLREHDLALNMPEQVIMFMLNRIYKDYARNRELREGIKRKYRICVEAENEKCVFDNRIFG